MADPKQKSQEFPAFLTRILPAWQSPQWMEAERWRRTVANQPVAMICQETIINDVIASELTIKAKDDKEEGAVQEDVDYYTDLINNAKVNGMRGFDSWVEAGGKDLLTLPIGWNNEIVRWKNGQGPLSRPHPKGHPADIVFIDGATLYPTFDKQFPMAQRVKGDVARAVFFREDEISRSVMSLRPELERWGYGMAPPEKIFLSILALFYSDRYYANLLLDTPEAGLLDLIDMEQESAEEWLSSFRELMSGIDPMKIGVLYQHQKAAEFIPFGRPPTEMMFDSVTGKYSRITHAGYGLTETDTGLGESQKTLAGSIRQERQSRRSGYAVTKEKIRVMLQKDVLPPYLEAVWVERDEEAKVQKGRAFLLDAQALAASKNAGFISPQEGQAQLVKAGHITIEVQKPEEIEAPQVPPMLPPPDNSRDREPAEAGGRGDITVQQAELGDEEISSVPRDSSKFDQMANVIRQEFAGVKNRMERPRLIRLIKSATRAMFPDVTQAFIELADTEIPLWKDERLKLWFGEKSEFDEYPDVTKASGEVLDAIDDTLNSDDWWQIQLSAVPALALIMQLAFEEGATEAGQFVHEFLYTEGLRDTPNIVGLNFQLSNPRTLAQLEQKAAQLVTRINDGTRFFMQRILVAGVDEGLASPAIAQLIRDGAGVEDILKEAGFNERVAQVVRSEVENMTAGRTNSIVNTEIAKAETDGRVIQFQQMGLTKKQWVHTGPDTPCRYCQGNIDLGMVPVDFLYETVFGPAEALGPPAHPQVDHCHIEFDEAELIGKADTLQVWTGE